MPSVLYILRKRQVRRRQVRSVGRFGLGCSLLTSLAAAVGGLVLVLAYASLVRGLPTPAALPDLLDPPNGSLLQPTRFYDRSGERLLLTLENTAAAGRQILAPEQLPPALVSATLASADPGFWRHPGFSLAGLAQAQDPTLAQRLVSNWLLWEEPPGLRRSIREGLLAAEITTAYGRERVLAWYLNSADFGRLAFGADAAARVYFGKPASELSLAEAALLAAVAQAPESNPHDAPGLAIQEKDALLGLMEQGGWISPQQAETARGQALAFSHPAPSPSALAPAFLSLVISQLENENRLQRLAQGGWRVITTLDGNLQTQADCAAALQLARLAQRPAPAGDCPAGRFLPSLPAPTAPLDAVQWATVVLDPQNGQVLAMSGAAPLEGYSTTGEPASPGQLSGLTIPSLEEAHPAGTLLTPWIYFTAFTQGWSTASLVWDVPAKEEGVAWPGPAFLSGSNTYQGPLRLRMALANDRLAPAAQILASVGPENVAQAASQFGLGLDDLLGAGALDVSLLAARISLVQAAQAFGVFANQGVLAGASPGSGPDIHPITVFQIENIAGQVVWAGPQRQLRPVTSPQLAYLVTDALSDETARWPTLGHPNVLEVGRPAAAKLGRTASGKDGWALGFTPQAVFGVWAGYPETTGTQPLQAGTGATEIAAALWHALVSYASQDSPAQGWEAPTGISRVEVCDPSGLLPTADCPAVVSEIFLTGSEPTQSDTLFNRIAINRETGRLATLFTPPELVEERIFLAAPPQASDWARATGLPAPPETFDVILGPLSLPGRAELAAPELFATVRGRLRIIGTAAGNGFQRYRLQAGSGLYPRAWVQIGADSGNPVEAGELGVWDTTGLDGLYALQLLVIRQDNRVDRAAVQVNVDNQPPQVTIPYPEDGRVFGEDHSGIITFQVDAQDNLGLRRVEYFVDGQQVARQVQPPFAYPWDTTKGEHTLQVQATDQAGNTAEAVTRFVVK